MKMLRFVLSGMAVLLGVLVGPAMSAVEVKYQAVDVPNPIAGSDRWLYNFTLTGDFALFEGVTLLFAPASFSGLALAAPPDPVAFATVIGQPDSSLFADGLFTLSAARVIGTETFAFSVAFDWLGNGVPAGMPFETFDASFNITGGGVSVAIPEPAQVHLMLGGLIALAGLVVRRRRAAVRAPA